MSIQDDITMVVQQLARVSDRITELIRKRQEIEEMIPALNRIAQQTESEVNEHIVSVRNKFGSMRHKTKFEERYMQILQETIGGTQVRQAIQDMLDEASAQQRQAVEITEEIESSKARMLSMQANLDQLKVLQMEEAETV